MEIKLPDIKEVEDRQYLIEWCEDLMADLQRRLSELRDRNSSPIGEYRPVIDPDTGLPI